MRDEKTKLKAFDSRSRLKFIALFFSIRPLRNNFKKILPTRRAERKRHRVVQKWSRSRDTRPADTLYECRTSDILIFAEIPIVAADHKQIPFDRVCTRLIGDVLFKLPKFRRAFLITYIVRTYIHAYYTRIYKTRYYQSWPKSCWRSHKVLCTNPLWDHVLQTSNVRPTVFVDAGYYNNIINTTITVITISCESLG